MTEVSDRLEQQFTRTRSIEEVYDHVVAVLKEDDKAALYRAMVKVIAATSALQYIHIPRSRAVVMAMNVSNFGKWIVLCCAAYASFHLDGLRSWLVLGGLLVLFKVTHQLQTFFNVLIASRIFFVDPPALQAWLNTDLGQ